MTRHDPHDPRSGDGQPETGGRDDAAGDDTSGATADRALASRRSVLAASGAVLAGGAVAGAAGVGGVLAQSGGGERTFAVRLENVSDGETLSTTADGGDVGAIEDVNGYEYPAVSDVLRLRVTPN